MADTTNDIITVTCDENYSPYARVFVNSLNSHNENINVAIRAVNCSTSCISMLKSLGSNVTVIDDRPDVSSKRNLLSHGQELVYDGLFESLTKNKTSVRSPRLLCSEQMAYCSNIKFQTIKTLLEKHNRVIYMDIDSIIRDDISELFNITSSGDIAMYKDAPYTEQHPGSSRLQGNEVLYHGGLIGFNNTERSKQLINDWVDVVTKDMFNWDVDEDIFYSAHHDNTVNIICVPVTYKDEDLEYESAIWSGAGQTKFSQDRYINECKKYDTQFT